LTGAVGQGKTSLLAKLVKKAIEVILNFAFQLVKRYIS
jgi:predicted ATPase